MHNLIQVLREPVIIIVCKSVVHLNGALRIAHVSNFVLTSQLFDRLNIGFDVVLHVRPGEVPVLLCGFACCIIDRMVLTVLGASIISDPNIVAFVSQEQVERFFVVEILYP